MAILQIAQYFMTVFIACKGGNPTIYFNMYMGSENQCSMNPIQTVSANVHQHCVLACTDNPACASFMYDPDTKQCTLLRSKDQKPQKIVGSSKIHGQLTNRLGNDECTDGYCQNGGTCVNVACMFTCICTSEWTGTQCEKGPVCIPEGGTCEAFSQTIYGSLSCCCDPNESSTEIPNSANCEEKNVCCHKYSTGIPVVYKTASTIDCLSYKPIGPETYMASCRNTAYTDEDTIAVVWMNNGQGILFDDSMVTCNGLPRYTYTSKFALAQGGDQLWYLATPGFDSPVVGICCLEYGTQLNEYCPNPTGKNGTIVEIGGEGEWEGEPGEVPQ